MVTVAEVDGPGLRLYHRAKLDGNPVMAPDGRTVAFSRSRLVKVLPGRENYLIKSAIWLLNVKTGKLRRLTRWRLQTSLEPSSFSPDGTKIGAINADGTCLTRVFTDPHLVLYGAVWQPGPGRDAGRIDC